MITDEELESLPEDPQLAFVEFERIAREALTNELMQAENGRDDLRLEYLNKVVGAAKAFGIDGLRDWKVPSAHQFDYSYYANFVSDVDHYTIQIRIHAASRSRRYSVGLDDATKIKIRHFVEQIKLAIEAADLSVEKKEVLFKKLSKFLEEVDRARTPFQALADAWLFFCGVAGDGIEKLEPARKWLDSIAKLMGHAKELEDLSRPRLVPPDDRPRLEPPRNVGEPFGGSDDEIPF